MARTRVDDQDRVAARKLLGYVLERDRITAVYQPIVDLHSGDVVAFEALARGPEGSALESPSSLFGAARRAGRLTELEWACRAAAVRGALEADLGSQLSLFINVEPSVVGGVIPDHLDKLFRQAARKLRMVLELTERDLTRRPADLLRLVGWAREQWWGVALDDVGAAPESLALLPFVAPDVVKLDMRLIQVALNAQDRRLIEAVHHHCHWTGATVLAEGIENEEHLRVALELDATLGQGWHFGRPGTLEQLTAGRNAVRLLPGPGSMSTESCFDLLAATELPAIVAGAALADATAELERRAFNEEPAPVVLAALGTADAVADRAATYDALAERCPLVGVLGTGVEPTSGSAVRLTPLDAGDPIGREWVVAVVGPDRASAVAARPVGKAGFSGDVDLVVSDDRDAVLAAARLLMGRVVPAQPR